MKATSTLVKSLFVQQQSDKLHQPQATIALKHFGKSAAVTQLLTEKQFTDPSQADYATIAATQQFINLIEQKSLVGKIKALNKHLEVTLNTPVSSLDFSPCEVVQQAQPTAILNEASNLGINLDFNKIGGYAIFPNRYFEAEYFAKVEPLINSALINSYSTGENADFIATIATGATAITATGTAKAELIADITIALNSIDDAQNALILMNPQTALAIATALEINTLGVNGGSIFGVKVITSKSIAKTKKYIFDLSKLMLAADPSLEIKLTDEATVQGTTGQSVHLFQESKVAVKIMGINGYEFAPDYVATVIEG